MPLVQIEMFPGRSPELKREIAQRLTAMLDEVAGIRPDATTVIFRETAAEDWFHAGRAAAGTATEDR